MSIEWQFLRALNDRLRPLKDPVEIQDVAVRVTGEHLRASRVNYSLIEGDEFAVRRTWDGAGAPFSGRGPVARFGAAVVNTCRRGETAAIEDVRTDPRLTDAERHPLLALGIDA